MKTNNKLLIKTGNEVVMEMVYIASTQEQHLFSKLENVVYPPDKAVLWGDNGIGTTSFVPIRKKHNYIKLDDDTWELDVEPINVGDL